MEVAGLVLGAIPIVIWALENYAKPFRDSDNERIVIGTLRTGLLFQQERLKRTYERIGLDKPSDKELEDRLNELFPQMAEHLLLTIREMDRLVSAVLTDLKVDKQQPLWVEPSDRMQFEWHKVKRKFKLKHCQKVLEELRVWNGDLEKYLEKPEVPATTDGLAVQDLVLRFNAKRCNIVRESMKSFHRALSYHIPGCACRSPHQVTVQLDWSACEADSGVSRAAFQVSSGSPALSANCWRKLHVVPQVITDTEHQLQPAPRSPQQLPVGSGPRGRTPSPSPPRTPSPLSSILSRISRIRLKIPFSYTPVAVADPQIEVVTNAQAPVKIYNICDYIRDRDNIGSLHGYIRDPGTAGGNERRFVLKDASENQTSESMTRSLSLKLLLNSGGRKFLPALTRKHRYGIAVALCWSVLHLSGSPWLEKELDAERAMLLYTTLRSRHTLSRHPSLSCRLPEPKRPGSPARGERTPRRAPNKTAKLIYSLGVALIELCIDNPFDTPPPSPYDQTPLLGGRAIPEDCMRELVESVRAKGGDPYGDAVERCVTFVFQGAESKRDFENPDFRRVFYSTVVAPVQATYQMMPEMGDRYDD